MPICAEMCGVDLNMTQCPGESREEEMMRTPLITELIGTLKLFKWQDEYIKILYSNGQKTMEAIQMMDFKNALVLLNNGKKLTRCEWDSNAYIQKEGDTIVNFERLTTGELDIVYDGALSYSDCVANDWILYTEGEYEFLDQNGNWGGSFNAEDVTKIESKLDGKDLFIGSSFVRAGLLFRKKIN